MVAKRKMIDPDSFFDFLKKPRAYSHFKYTYLSYLIFIGPAWELYGPRIVILKRRPALSSGTHVDYDEIER